MRERIKELRKAEGLTQQEFGERIGIKQSTVATYESGRNEPTEAVIVAICREFNVREEWLRRGEGPMREPLTRKEEITKFFDECSTLPDDDFRAVIIEYLATTDADGWALLEKELRRLAALLPAGEPQDTDQLNLFAPAKPEIVDGLTVSQRAELAEMERQMRLETKAAEKSLVSGSTGKT